MKSKFRKLLFVLMQPLTYSIRPMFLQPKPVGYMEVRRARMLALTCKIFAHSVISPQIANFAFIILTNALVWYFWGARSVAYMVGSTLIGMSLHPVSGHLIAEHFEYTSGQVCARAWMCRVCSFGMLALGSFTLRALHLQFGLCAGVQETYSYYGPLNALVYNVGYHNEHHDFPKVRPFDGCVVMTYLGALYFDFHSNSGAWQPLAQSSCYCV